MTTEHPRIRVVATKVSTGLVASTDEVAGIRYHKIMEFSTP